MSTPPKKLASVKAMDLLAIRDHSRLELQEKLLKKGYEPEEVEKALRYVEDHGWLLPPEELSAKTAQVLHDKRKSHHYIVQYLKSKKLPPVEKHPPLELKKALDLVDSRLSDLLSPSQDSAEEPVQRGSEGLSFDHKKRINQFLSQRGYDWEVIQKVLNGAKHEE